MKRKPDSERIDEADSILQEEQKRMKKHEKWIEDWENWGLTQIP